MSARFFVRLLLAGVIATSLGIFMARGPSALAGQENRQVDNMREPVLVNAAKMIEEGRQTFRYDTFGDEAFWGGKLRLHDAIAGAAHGGVGGGLSPRVALSLGLKVDVDALPREVNERLSAGAIDLDSSATTLDLLWLNAVVGLTGFFDSTGSHLVSVGIQCALCHSTVDDSVAPGVGHRLEGLANHDLNIGAIVAVSPDVQPVADFLGTDVATVRQVLNSWGAGKFDAELFLDGKAFNPEQMSHGVVTGRNVSGATLIPNASGLAGYNQHTWTGGWGTVSYWNAFVAALEMHGTGTFVDPRLDDATRYPIAARNRLGHMQAAPDDDRITAKLPALHFYQLAIPVPKPTPGEDFLLKLHSAAMSYSAARRNAMRATWSLCGRSRAGICTLPQRSALTRLKQTALPIAPIRHRTLPVFLSGRGDST